MFQQEAGLARIQGLMIDMDGTLCRGWEVIEGAPEFIAELNEAGMPYVLLTNNSSASRESYLHKMRTLGFPVGMENILSSTTATLLFLQEERPGKSVYPLGTPDFMAELEASGIEVSDDAPIVLLAFDRSITYEKINRAYQLLKDGAELVCTHPDQLCPTEDGYDVDIGPFITLFQSLLEIEPVVVGKPNRLMAEMSARHMGVALEGLAMIGDRLYTDMRMAVENDLTSILVLSGEAEAGELEGSTLKPDLVLGSVRDLLGAFKNTGQ